jgi:hypothetical protein
MDQRALEKNGGFDQVKADLAALLEALRGFVAARV